MLYGARIGLLLLSALSAHMVPACGRSYGRDRDVARAATAPDHVSFTLAALLATTSGRMFLIAAGSSLNVQR